MKNSIVSIAAVCAVSLTLAGCAGSADSPQPTVTETVSSTTTDAPAPAPEPEPEPEPSIEEDIAGLALEMVWEETPATEREDICFGMEFAPEMMIDTFMEVADDDLSIDREQVMDFFTGKCANIT